MGHMSKSRFTDIAVNADDQRSLRLRIKVAGRDETIAVTGEAPLVRESPSVATSVGRTFIENQPLNGRSFQTLINLSPGVVLVTSTLPDAGQFSVNGQRSGTNYFTVDGVGANFGFPLLQRRMKAEAVERPRTLRKAAQGLWRRWMRCKNSLSKHRHMRRNMAASRARK